MAPDKKPIAGIDLEAEQVVEEEREKPLASRRPKIRMSYLVFGAIVVVEAIVLVLVLGEVSGSNPAERVHAEGIAPESRIHEAKLEELEGWGMLEIGDVSISEPSIDHPGRTAETTVVAVKVWIATAAWAKAAPVLEANPAAEQLIIMDVRDHVRRFMSMYGGENLAQRQETLGEDLLRYFGELNRDSIGGLSRNFTRVGFEKVKFLQR